MEDLQPLGLLIEKRKQHWLMHNGSCRAAADTPCHEGKIKTTEPYQRVAVIIDNRIDEQWLFTV